MKRLDLKQLPLASKCLIEASAGTGKTYTLSHLLVDFILQGDAENKVHIDSILVVTFTRAATQELRERIRSIFHTVKKRLLYWDHLINTDLDSIIDKALQLNSIDVLVKRCNLALLSLDNAPIMTIHGFCQSVLNDFSFDAHQAIGAQLVEDNSDFIKQLIVNLWREIIYPLPIDEAILYQKVLKNPDYIYDVLSSTLSADLIDPIDNDLIQVTQTIESARALYQSAQKQWCTDQEAINNAFAKGIGRSYSIRHVGKWLTALADYLENPTFQLLLWPSAEKFCQATLLEKLADKAPHFALFTTLDELTAVLSSLNALMMSHFRARLIKMASDKQLEENIIFFDDLIQRVASAITKDDLALSIAKRYPIALIDEFQDTDQWQYHIFEQIYRLPNTRLVLIGDPKQAIYGFRGADINAYLLARDKIAAQYTLNTNFRSIPTLINQVNSFFCQHKNPFVIEDFGAFFPVLAPTDKSNDAALEASDIKTSVSVLYPACDDTISVQQARKLAAESTARWLKTLFTTKARINKQLLAPRDIAILVRKSSQAIMMKQALTEVGLNSVYLQKESVLTSQEAEAFYFLLTAMHKPEQISLINRALGSMLIGFSLEKINSINQSSDSLLSFQSHFFYANSEWKNQAFHRAVSYLIQQFSIDLQLLAQPQGERSFTNFNQLIEFFTQSISDTLPLIDQISDFVNHCDNARATDESQKIRLDTEANLIEIVTIHQSKGLEYPLVCCPFIFESIDKPLFPPVIISSDQTRWLKFKPSDEEIAQLKKANLAEEIRLLYVALTRAESHLSFCYIDIKKSKQSALNWLFNHDEPLLDQFNNLGFDVIQPQDTDDSSLPAKEQPDVNELTTFPLERSISSHFVARSYSHLVQSHSHNQSEKDRDEVDELVEVVSETIRLPSIFTFMKGAEAGNLLHHILEDINFSDDKTHINDMVKTKLPSYGIAETPWLDVLTSHIAVCLKQVLLPFDFSLSQLDSKHVIKELGFEVNVKPRSGYQMNSLLANYRKTGVSASFNAVDGVFKGFVDLIFIYNNQYFIADYKSNFLGFNVSDYNKKALDQAIQSHYYDAQYLFYLAALQRILKLKHPDFDYEKHIGGVFYLFLRGMNLESGDGIYFTKPDADIVEAFEQNFIEGSL